MSRTCAAPVKLDRQSQVCYATEPVLFHQDVFALQVSVRDGRFALRAVDLRVQMAQARYGGVGQFEQGLDI